MGHQWPTFASDEADKFAHTLLHALFGFFGDLSILGQGHLHNAGDWRKVSNVSIVYIKFVQPGSALRFGRLGRRVVRHGQSD